MLGIVIQYNNILFIVSYLSLTGSVAIIHSGIFVFVNVDLIERGANELDVVR